MAHHHSSRLAAVLVALALAGAPQLLEARRPGATHRCHCPVLEGRHDCDCPLCHAEAVRAAASARASAGVPPCHRAAAAAGPPRRAPSKHAAPAGPALTASCGGSEERLRPPPTSEPFPVPPPPALAHRAVGERVVGVVAGPRVTAALPDPPPPKAA